MTDVLADPTAVLASIPLGGKGDGNVFAAHNGNVLVVADQTRVATYDSLAPAAELPEPAPANVPRPLASYSASVLAPCP